MNAFFLANPGWLWAMAAALPVAVAYLFHRRYKPLRVTGLFLWGVPERSGEGGRTLEPPVVNRSFLFDMLAALLLGLALAGPSIRIPTGLPVVVVLDDSFSMRARDCHVRARTAAVELLQRAATNGAATAVVLAGERPRILSGLEIPADEAAVRLDAYLPSDSAFDPAAALALAFDVFGDGLEVHILTNRPVDAPTGGGNRVSVRQFAGRGGNLAFADIWRERFGDGDRLFLTVRNRADASASGTLRVTEAGSGGDVFARPIDFAPNAAETLTIDIAGAAGETLLVRIDATAGGDVIADDSAAVLPPAPIRTVTYMVDGPSRQNARFFRIALEAAGCVPWTPADPPADGDAPDLLVTDEAAPTGRVLTLRVMPEKSPALLYPPYVADLADPLCRDVNLGLSRWALADSETVVEPERALLLADTIPLFWRESPDVLGLNLLPAAGDVAATSAWPALMANVAARAEVLLPGFGATLYRPGAELLYRPEPGAAGKVALVSAGRGVVAERLGRGLALPMACGYYEVTQGGNSVGGVSVLPLYGDASETSALAGADAEIVLSGTDNGADAGVMDLSWLALAAAIALVAVNWRRGQSR